MKNRATTVREYLAKLPADRQAAIEVVRKTILTHLPAGYEETMLYGMPTYTVPLSRYPEGYLEDKKTPLPYIALASQKNYMALYLMSLYGDPKLLAWFAGEYAKRDKKLDMGKSCVRFKKLDDLPLDVVGEVVARVSVDQYVKLYAKSRVRK